jgi:hypothetical protein
LDSLRKRDFDTPDRDLMDFVRVAQIQEDIQDPLSEKACTILGNGMNKIN